MVARNVRDKLRLAQVAGSAVAVRPLYEEIWSALEAEK
jgi:hypothetical protein